MTHKHLTWLSCTAGAAMLALGLYACSSDDGNSLPSTSSGTGGGTTTQPQGGAGGETSSSGEGGFTPFVGPCAGHAGEQICVDGNAVLCDENEQIASEEVCDDDICVPGGVGCILCIEGQFHCEGNQVQQCNVGPPPSWETIATCNAPGLEHCSSTKGVCVPLDISGDTVPTGVYYQYARFTSSEGFLGGYDVDSYDDLLYVNRSGSNLDVYQVELLDSDGDGEMEPNQHPDNPDLPGAVEERVLTHLQTYSVTIGQQSRAELYATDDSVYFVNYSGVDGQIYHYPFGGAVSTHITPTVGVKLAQMGLDEANGVWYGSSEAGRRVYSFHEPSGEWVAEFRYPDLAGSHMDGLEVVSDPDTGTVFVYVSDMTSDFIGQYRRDRDSGWVQENLFEYVGTGEALEGMGFGYLNHFWATGGSAVFEIGGGDLAEYVEPEPPPK